MQLPELDRRQSVTERWNTTIGAIEIVSPTRGDIHEVANALPDRASISIHVYGANIGAVRRHVFDPDTGASKSFISGYSSQAVPNLWDRSKAN